MSEPHSQEQHDREIGRRNLTRMVGIFGTIIGLGCVLLAAIDLILSNVREQPLRYDYFFFIGMIVVIMSWWFLLAGYGRKDDGERLIDCPKCGAFTTEGTGTTCSRCGHLLGGEAG